MQTFVWTSCRFRLVLAAFLEIQGLPGWGIVTETNIYNFASFTKCLIIHKGMQLCAFAWEKHRQQQSNCLCKENCVYKSLLYVLFKMTDLNIFSLVAANEGQEKTFWRQITGQQLLPAQINSWDPRLLRPSDNWLAILKQVHPYCCVKWIF